ncbi:hypothetical protein BGX21_008861 [Mortierella sp. AD011]|nr:hypothetical protein BGX20_009551 [Mortierella sp. AD010]KAF9397448.1 hypothetical protein BGX21_008861 [Mortierella sp. AD011]
MTSRGLLLSALAALLVVLQFNLVLGISNGIYIISGPLGQLADSGTVVTVLPEQQDAPRWKVEEMSNGFVYISNPESGKYLSYHDPHDEARIILDVDPKEWQLRQGQEPNSYKIVAPGGPVDGFELAIDVSRILIFPPLAALRSYEYAQPWSFVSQE